MKTTIGRITSIEVGVAYVQIVRDNQPNRWIEITVDHEGQIAPFYQAGADLVIVAPQTKALVH